MTANRDPDSIIRAWLDQMPSEAPDRAIAAVLEAVEETPPARRPFGTAIRRFSMTPRLSLAAGFAAIVVVVGGAFLVGSRPTGPASTPLPSLAPSIATGTPAPSSAGSQSPSTAVLPATFDGSWVGAPRDIPGFGVSPRTVLVAQSNTLAVKGLRYSPAIVQSFASVETAGTLTVAASAASAGCTAGDVGSYPYTLSTTERILTIRPGTDPCVARSAGLVGTWFHSVCRRTADACLGDLEAGTYDSQFIAPRLDPGATWTDAYGAIRYTVPDGWANSSDFPSTFGLTPSVDYASEGPDGAAVERAHEIWMYTQPAATIQDGTCAGIEDPEVDRSVSGLIAYLRGRPGLKASAPGSMTVAGRPATWVDLQVDIAANPRCPDETNPGVDLLTAAGKRPDGFGVGLFGAERIRVILVDLGSGDVLGISIDSSDPARFDELVRSATPIVEGLVIAP